MAKENISLDFKLNKKVETRNYLLEEMKRMIWWAQSIEKSVRL